MSRFLKTPALLLGLAAGACAPSLTSGHQASPYPNQESRLNRAADSLPFSMMGAPEEEVIQKVLNTLKVLGPYSKLGPQADGSIVECEVAPQRDMALSMAIINVMQTLKENRTAISELPSAPPFKPDSSTLYPEILLKGSSSTELSTKEFISCIQAKRNPIGKAP